MPPVTVTRSQLAGVSAGRLLQGHIAPAPFNERWSKVWGSELTPSSVTQVLANASAGYLWYLADLLDEVVGRDLHLQSVLTKRIMRVTSAEWELRAPAGSGKRAEGIAKWCQERLLEIEGEGDLGRSFYDGITDLLGAVFYGRGLLEAVWTQDGRWWHPSALEFVHSRRCAYASNWDLHVWDFQGTNTSMVPTPDDLFGYNGPFGRFPGIPISALPSGKFIAHRPRVRGTYPTIEGLGTILVWYCMFKRSNITNWMALSEWAGRGMRIGTFQSGNDPNNPGRASGDDRDDLIAAMNDLSSAVSSVIPDTSKIEIVGMPQNNDIHEKLLYSCNNEITKAVLLETLTTEVGVTGGNRALGEVHDDIGRQLAVHDAKQLCQTIRRDVLRPMVWRSFGKNAPVPTMHFALEAEQDLSAMVERIVSLLKESDIDIGKNWVREQLGIPELEPGEEPLTAARKALSQPGDTVPGQKLDGKKVPNRVDR